MLADGEKPQDPPRASALPEHVDYRDTGCSVAPRCLECPLPVCRYEVPGGLRGALTLARDEEIRELRAAGPTVEQLAARFGVTTRTVRRSLARQAPRATQVSEGGDG